MRNTVAAVLLAAGLMALLASPAAAQCAMCKTVLTGSEEGRAIGAQFNRAILVMMAAPYLVLGCFVLALFRGSIRDRGARIGARVRALARRAIP